MSDVFTKEKRSEVMSKIRATNTKPELIVRHFLFSQGFRYRIHQKDLAGNPDIVLKKHNTLIFVNGCFWHGHTSQNCKISRIPKSNSVFWETKIDNNKKRDAKNRRILKKQGWNLITIWECKLNGKNRENTLNTIVDKILKEK